MQSRLTSLQESCLNTASGFVISYLMWILVVAPMFNLPGSHSTSFWITTIFTVTSVIRSYVWRRIFNKHAVKKMEKQCCS